MSVREGGREGGRKEEKGEESEDFMPLITSYQY